jgi:hypothetical protein
MQKLSAKWAPKCLKVSGASHSSEQLLDSFLLVMRDPNDFLSRLVTMEETWFYHYDQAT